LFQVNPATGDKRISGSLASLTGIEAGLDADDALATDLGVQRILMGTALMASFGGLPLIYMGDEIALLNDYSYRDVAEHRDDSRWIHRPRMDWDRAAQASDPTTLPGQVLRGTRTILRARAATPALHGAVPTRVLNPDAPQVFAFARLAPTGPVICLFNFSEQMQQIPSAWLRAAGVVRMHDVLSGQDVGLHDGALVLLPYGRVWLI
jgi:amylosucrase